MKRNFHYTLFVIVSFLCITCKQSANQPTNKPTTTQQNTQKDFTEVGIRLLEQEKIGGLQIEQKEDKVLSRLGEPDKKSKLTLWGADGLYHQTWTYAKMGVELDMAKKENGVLALNGIDINEPCGFRTSRNISIGSDYMSVLKTYKYAIAPENVHKGILIAGSLYGGIVFRFKDEKVHSIFLGASAE